MEYGENILIHYFESYRCKDEYKKIYNLTYQYALEGY